MRTPTTKALRLLAAALALMLIAAACGGDDDSDDDASPAATTAAPATTAALATTQPEPEAPAAFDPSVPFFLSDTYSQSLEAASTTSVDTSAFATDAPYNLATIVQGPTNGWGTTFDVVMNWAIEESGQVDDVLYVPWDFTTESQSNGIDDAIARGVDAILLTSLSRAGLAAPVERATSQGIPVLTCMAGVESDAYTVEVSRNIPAQGYASARVLADSIGGEGNVVLLHGIAGVDAAEFWRSGALEAFSEFPGINVLDEQYGNWSVADATDAMRAVVRAHDQIDGVWVGGLEMGVSVINVFNENDLDIPFMAGTNPINGFLRLAIENDVQFSAAPFPPGSSSVCVERLLALLNGESMNKFIDVVDELNIPPVITHDDAADWYVPELNDDFVGPVVAPIDVYVNGGFGR